LTEILSFLKENVFVVGTGILLSIEGHWWVEMKWMMGSLVDYGEASKLKTNSENNYMIQWNPDNCKTRLTATVFWVPRSCNYPGFTVYAFLT
jgi:hypothetical protein